MRRGKEEEGDGGELLRLWICRIFASAAALERLVRKRDFGDEDVAWALRLREGPGLAEDDYDPEAARRAVKQLGRELEARSGRIRAPRRWRENLQAFGKLLGLGRVQQQILLLVAVRSAEPVLGDAIRLLREHRRREHLATVARMLGLPAGEVREAVSGRGRLMQSGLLKWSRMSRTGETLEMTNDGVGEALLSDTFSVEAAIRNIAMPAPPPTLAFRDYPHLKETLGYLRRYLRDALLRGAPGVNIYLHGMPGTGKSELARVLARELRVRLYEVSSQDSDGDPNTGNRRLMSLRLAQSLLAGQRALLVFDEAEDVFTGPLFGRSVASERKGWMNRMLESNAVPTLWLSNACRGLDAAFLRRFDFVFEVATPPRGQRIRTFRRICAETVTAPALERLAACERLAPAVVARAHAVVERACPGEPVAQREQALLHLVGHTLRAQGHDAGALEQRGERVPKVFDLEFLNSDRPLAEIADNLGARSSCRMCLHGPPGTGKTTFGHWLARKLGLSLQVKRASDILSPFLGETEQQIARAFRDAREDEAILMIDEVDGFLRDRRTAVRAWEVSQVNELLTQMERFEGIFIASTNLAEGIDPASLRRFDLKVAFGFLREEQARRLLQRHCRALGLRGATTAQLDEIGRLANLTPGDFANAARQHRFRRFAGAGAFLQAVVDECRMKEGGPRRKAGF